MDMPQVDHRHQQLAKLAGHWQGEEVMPPSPWTPGGVAQGFVHNRVDLTGFVLIQDYRQEQNGTPSFFGHGVFTIDNDEVVLYWFDSMGSPPNIFRGHWASNQLQLQCDSPMPSRTTFILKDANHYEFEMDMQAQGTEWQNMMRGHYTRCE